MTKVSISFAEVSEQCNIIQSYDAQAASKRGHWTWFIFICRMLWNFSVGLIPSSKLDMHKLKLWVKTLMQGAGLLRCHDLTSIDAKLILRFDLEFESFNFLFYPFKSQGQRNCTLSNNRWWIIPNSCLGISLKFMSQQQLDLLLRVVETAENILLISII